MESKKSNITLVNSSNLNNIIHHTYLQTLLAYSIIQHYDVVLIRLKSLRENFAIKVL